MRVSVSTLGATATNVRFGGKECAIGYDTPEGYLNGKAYIGAIVGRYGNRIAGARFNLNGKEYRLTANEGRNQLHGGVGFDKKLWDAEVMGENAVRFTLFSPDGEDGYPANLTASVVYTVMESGFSVDFYGIADADTVFAPTTHIYWNLCGAGNILDTELQLASKAYLPIDGESIPTGIAPAVDAFDFTAMKPIATDFDHCFVLNGSPAAIAEANGIRLTVETDFPALQFYTGTSLDAPHGKNGGFALEPEYYPNSPNEPSFPSPILKAGERFHKSVTYRFERA